MEIENNIISKEAGISHLQTALNFLENADRFHDAWSHWMDGNSGTVLPFSTMDNGADLVETALLYQGLICIREYLKNGNTAEQQLAQKPILLEKGLNEIGSRKEKMCFIGIGLQTLILKSTSHCGL